jgi:hypothetical protein
VRRLSPLLLPLVALSTPAGAVSTRGIGTDEVIGGGPMVTPTVIFVVDLSADMALPCEGLTGDSCLVDTLEAIDSVIRLFDDAQYGVIGTSPLASSTFYQVAPVGSTYPEISAALGTLAAATPANQRNLAEVLGWVSANYLSLSATNDDENDNGDAFTGDWTESPIGASCSDTHLVVLARGTPTLDNSVTSAVSSGTPSSDVICDASGVLATSEFNCYYDNAAYALYRTDHRGSASGTQRAKVHTVGLNLASGSVADSLFANAADQGSGDLLYTNVVPSGGVLDESNIVAGILQVTADIAAGTYARSSPVVSTDGATLLSSYYTMSGDNPLAEGHLRAYALDNDTTSSTYGDIVYQSGSPYSSYGGATWDAGDLLAARAVSSGESNENDRDGNGARDIYFYEAGIAPTMISANGSYSTNRRLPFDVNFVSAAGSSTTLLHRYLDTGTSGGTPGSPEYDLDQDGSISSADLQVLVDFVRGVPTTEYRYLAAERGTWRLGDSPYGAPVIVTSDDDRYTNLPTYRAFLDFLRDAGLPDIVLATGNDGMLHAFDLDSGEERWAWVPGYTLLRERDAEWSGGLIDMTWYGRTFLFDGEPVVDDAWIDEDNDGVVDCDSLADCEWRRVAVVRQGIGGPVTLALDITDPGAPEFLWEVTNDENPTAMGFTTGRPVVLNIYDTGGSTDGDRAIVLWAGGRSPDVYGASGTYYYETTGADLYTWALGDDAWSGGMDERDFPTKGDNIYHEHPDFSGNGGGEGAGVLKVDSDNQTFELSFISATPAVVDVDGDGDADVAYFPVSTPYRPDDEGGAGAGTLTTEGSSWIYKVIFSSSDPEEYTWCTWYDPLDGNGGASGGGIGERPEVFYSVTTTVLSGGDIGVYWGTGTPFARDVSHDGYFFAMRDSSPLTCSTPEPLTCDGNGDGYYTLGSGEGLTADPFIYAGVAYFTTYEPDGSDDCELGTGRIYGLRYDDCSPGMDTNLDGEANSSDATHTTVSDTFVSNVTVGPSGKLYYGAGDGSGVATASAVTTLDTVDDPFLGTALVSWMEVF